MDWLLENKEWVFSGVGVLAISVIIGLFVKKSSGNRIQQRIESGKNSTNIQNSSNVRVRNGRIDDK